jgi:hypothetical protein
MVHDSASASRKLLADVAAATGLAVKKLAIRRQGYGTTLATLEFIEFPAGEGGALRIYSTEADADTVARHGLARVLLAYSRLGVLMVGDLPAHALAAAFKPLRDASSPARGRTATCCCCRSRRPARSRRKAPTSGAAPASRCAAHRPCSGRRTHGTSSAAPGAGCARRSPRPAWLCRR